MAKQKSNRGRPKADRDKAFTQRHVVNLSPEIEAAMLAYAEENGIGRLTDAIRQALVRFLKSEGKL